MKHMTICCLALCLALLFTSPSVAGTSPSGAPADWQEAVSDDAYYGMVLFDNLEYLHINHHDMLHWDAQGWYGGDLNRLWVKTEGDQRLDGAGGEIERFDVSYGRMISPFWDLHAGIGYQGIYGSGDSRNRVMAVVGFQGMAPYRFEVDANLRMSDQGDISADLGAEYDLLLTQRLVLQPRLDTALAVQEVKEFGVGKGINFLGLGLRLRYEIRRELAPYIGFTWTRKLGDTADLARADGEDAEDASVVAGLRFWY